MKKKGIVLLLVICVVLVFAILAVPTVMKFQQNSETTYSSIINSKADEIAYGGYKAVERYIIDEKRNFTNEIKSKADLAVTYTFDIIYNTNEDKKTVTAVMSNPVIEGKNLKSVDVRTTVNFGEEEGVYTNKITFSTAVTPGYILFPEDPHYIITRGLDGDTYNATNNYDSIHRKGLYDRLAEREIFYERIVNEEITEEKYTEATLPNIGDGKHIAWLKENSNFIEKSVSSNTTYKDDDIAGWITELASKENGKTKEDRNYLNVVYLNFTNTGNTATFLGNQVNDTEDKYYNISYTYDINIDVSSLGNGLEDTDFIIITNAGMEIPTNYSARTYRFNIKGGNVYFMSNGRLNLGTNANILHEVTEHEDIAPQLTFASTYTGGPFTNMYFYFGNLQNTYFYFPHSDTIGSLMHNIPNVNYGKSVVSGGMTLGQTIANYQSYGNPGAYEGESFNRSYHSRVAWDGYLEYCGYLID